MKNSIIVLFLVCMMILTSCSDNSGITLISTVDFQMEKSSIETQELAIENTDNKQEISNIGGQGCQIHGLEYHEVPYSLITYVNDIEAVDEWFESLKALYGGDVCPGVNGGIYGFIHEFDIPKSVFIEKYNSQQMGLDYPIDLLYNGSAEEVDVYYREAKVDEEKIINRIKWSNLNEIKMDLVELIREKTGEKYNYLQYSVLELVDIAGLAAKATNSTILNKVSIEDAENIYDVTYDYDLSLLSTDKATRDNMISEHSAYYLDCLFCGLTPYETRYEQQCAENEVYFKEHNIVPESKE